VSATRDIEGWRLNSPTDADLDELMSWFPDGQAVAVWGGPRFRFPFDRESFKKDCHWGEMATYALYSPDGEFAAFGQYYKRIGRINFARLIAHPDKRGQGIGKRLVQMLMTAAAEQFDLDEYSLFVYRDNAPALNCYLGLGFEIKDYPEGEVFADICYYLTRPVER
jgi:ribosomal protein S18 acetylase RimI-like enzyme